MGELLPRRAKPEHRARRALRPCSVGLEPLSFSEADRPLFQERCAGAPPGSIDDPDSVQRECGKENDVRGAPRGRSASPCTARGNDRNANPVNPERWDLRGRATSLSNVNHLRQPRGMGRPMRPARRLTPAVFGRGPAQMVCRLDGACPRPS